VKNSRSPLLLSSEGSHGYFSVLNPSPPADEQHHHRGGNQQHPRKHEGFEVSAKRDTQHTSQIRAEALPI